jgi:hypothetical protein
VRRRQNECARTSQHLGRLPVVDGHQILTTRGRIQGCYARGSAAAPNRAPRGTALLWATVVGSLLRTAAAADLLCSDGELVGDLPTTSLLPRLYRGGAAMPTAASPTPSSRRRHLPLFVPLLRLPDWRRHRRDLRWLPAREPPVRPGAGNPGRRPGAGAVSIGVVGVGWRWEMFFFCLD